MELEVAELALVRKCLTAYIESAIPLLMMHATNPDQADAEKVRVMLLRAKIVDAIRERAPKPGPVPVEKSA